MFFPGDYLEVCYRLTPQNIPFTVQISRSLRGGPYSVQSVFDDNGIGGGDCIDGTVDSELGVRTYQVLVDVDGDGNRDAEGYATAEVVEPGGNGQCRLGASITATDTVIVVSGDCSNQTCVVHINSEAIGINSKNGTIWSIDRDVHNTGAMPHGVNAPITGGGC